jgi:hypothetical protein
MSATPPTPTTRPRAVNVAFGCWVAADILAAAMGLLMVASQGPVPVFIRAVGGLLVVVGVAHGYLAGRTRRGAKRFAYAGVGLAMATVVFLAVTILFGAFQFLGILVIAVIMVLMITGSALIQGKTAQAWFDSEDGS